MLLIVVVALVVATGGVGLGIAYLDTRTLLGSVTGAGGAPLARAAVTAAGRSTFSDEKGAFSLEIPRGVWEVRAFADGYREATQKVDAGDWWTREVEAALQLEPKAWRGQVVARDTGQPVAGAQVQVEEQTLTTDAQGAFVVPGLRSGTKLHVAAEGYRDITVTIQTAEDEAETTLTLDAAEVRVKVVDAASQKPLPGVRVTAPGQSGNTDVQGEVVFKGVGRGAAIAAKAPGYADASGEAENDAQVMLQLQPTLLEGQLVNAANKERIGNAVLIAVGTDATVITQTVGSDGRFVIENITDVAKVYVKKPGYRLGSFELHQGGAREFALEPFDAKGIHLHYGITRAEAERLLNQFKGTEMNAVVFDVKEDPGLILWDSAVPLAKQIGAYVPREYTAQDEVATCRAYQLYCIARLTVFKDRLLAPARRDLALHNGAGGLLYENAAYWTNPAAQEVQDYHIALAKELAAMGFDEIQFDYIRYPGTTAVNAREFGDADTRVATVASFLERAGQALRETPAFFSGDVFGLTTATEEEQGIGQVWEKTTPAFDYVSPMMYPSTWRYATGLWGQAFGITNCGDAYVCPYDVIRYGTANAQERTKNGWTLVRPWIQAYGGVGFGLEQYKAQAQGADDAHSAGYLFWNNAATYPEGLFKKK